MQVSVVKFQKLLLQIIKNMKDFNHLVKTLKSSIKTWDYFVNWEKVFKNKSELEITLNKLNYLLGKEDLEVEFNKLFISNPDIIKALPVLLAVRENKLEVFDKYQKTSQVFNFSLEGSSSEECYEFLKKAGLENLFKKDGIKNLVDYVLGVEVGLDSNGRKNRGGKLMEEIVGRFISDFCTIHGFEYLAQARPTVIYDKWGIEIKVNKSERSFDFAVFNPKSKKVTLFETNFYNGNGSKLKTVCGEFKNLFDELKSQGIDFIWITDGLGWHATKRPLEEVYIHNDFVFNLQMLEDGILEKINW